MAIQVRCRLKTTGSARVSAVFITIQFEPHSSVSTASATYAPRRLRTPNSVGALSLTGGAVRRRGAA